MTPPNDKASGPETPRTQAVIRKTIGLKPDFAYTEMISFTRQLERELAQAREALKDIVNCSWRSNDLDDAPETIEWMQSIARMAGNWSTLDRQNAPKINLTATPPAPDAHGAVREGLRPLTDKDVIAEADKSYDIGLRHGREERDELIQDLKGQIARLKKELATPLGHARGDDSARLDWLAARASTVLVHYAIGGWSLRKEGINHPDILAETNIHDFRQAIDAAMRTGGASVMKGSNE